MAITNKWTNPLSRSYQSIKSDLLNALKEIKHPETKQTLITDVSEGNIFVIIISLFSAIAEVLHYYIDNMAREFFLGTARRYSSVTKQGLLIDYRPHGANAATVDIILTRELVGSNSGTDINIPAGTRLTDNSGNTWLVARDVLWSSTQTSVVLPLIQHELYTNSILNGTTLSTPSLHLDTNLNGKYIQHDDIYLKLGDTQWTQVDTFAYSKPTDKHFMFVLDDTDLPTIVFGDGKFGAKPEMGSIIQLSYYITSGERGNITANSITRAPAIVTSVIPGVTCNNPYPSGDGMSYESIEILRRHISIHSRTLSIAITKQDFIDCAKMVPGVGEVDMEYICGRKIDLYISPINGGKASTELTTKVKEYLVNHAPMTTWLNVYSAGISQIKLTMEVTGRKGYSASDIQDSVLQALYNTYSPQSAKIGGEVRISDIYALIDNLPEVDYLYIKKFFISPWPKIIYGNKQLDLSLEEITKATGSMTYILSFSGTQTFSIYSVNGSILIQNQQITGGSINVADTKNGFNFSIKVQGSYQAGDKYSFTIAEPNMNYAEPGFNQVVFDDPSLLNLTVREVV